MFGHDTQPALTMALLQGAHSLLALWWSARTAFMPQCRWAVSRQMASGTSAADTAQQLTDMRHPAAWYPAARALQRTIICHLGPTNSGKTHAALEALKAAPSGLYCGPLRLLACEVSDRLNSSGLPCSLLTGQEVRQVAKARHTACTVEMAAVCTDAGSQVYDVAVVDEIQMLGDKGRGWAWTRALLGLRAMQLHVCGDPAVLPLLEQLAQDCGDDLQVHYYARLSPLVVSEEALGSLSKLRPGDALVAFSRRAVYGLQREVVRRAPWATPSLVYGALPPDARRHQAAAFNQASGKCDVLVASDAIGMGLNLGIQRVIFTALTKWDGRAVRSLTASEVRQIAGRAGRYHASSKHRHSIHKPSSGSPAYTLHTSHPPARPSSQQPHTPRTALDVLPSGSNSCGFVTCLYESDMPALHQAMQEPPNTITQATLLPRLEDLALYYTVHTEAARSQQGGSRQCRHSTEQHAEDSTYSIHTRSKIHNTQYHSALEARSSSRAAMCDVAVPLDAILQQYMQEARLQPHYSLADMRPMMAIARLLSGTVSSQLGISEQLTFCMAPADVSSNTVAAALLRFVALYVEDGFVPLAAARVHLAAQSHSTAVPRTEDELRQLEEAHAVLDLYMWLAYRMPMAFRDSREAQQAQAHLAKLITQGLEHLSVYHQRISHVGPQKAHKQQAGQSTQGRQHGNGDGRQERHGNVQDVSSHSKQRTHARLNLRESRDKDASGFRRLKLRLR